MRVIKYVVLRVLPERVLFELKKFHYARSLKSFWEKDVPIVERLVKPAQCVLDIGAHVGWYTRILSELVGERGRVYSIEPVPVTFDLLSFCVRRLGLHNVELIKCAISNETGDTLVVVPRGMDGLENHYMARIREDGEELDSRRQYEVCLKTIDSLFGDIAQRISFIKCDVEGHELSVVRGSQRIIAKFKPAWLIEVTGDPDEHGSNSYSLFEYMGRHGYKPYWCDLGRLRKRNGEDKSDNYFFLTSEQVDVLEIAGMMIHSEIYEA